MKEHFKINNLIDLGTNGKFLPGRERALYAKLSSMKEGEKIFDRLVNRGAITPEKDLEVETEKTGANAGDGNNDKGKGKDPKKSKKDGGENGDGDGGDENGEDDDGDENKTPQYEPTGKYEFKPYGGGNCEIVDPKGYVIDTIRGHEKAEAKIKELNSELE